MSVGLFQMLISQARTVYVRGTYMAGIQTGSNG